jgi:hypothetical protein
MGFVKDRSSLKLLDALRGRYRKTLFGLEFEESKKERDYVFKVCKRHKIDTSIIQMDQDVFNIMSEKQKLSYFK